MTVELLTDPHLVVAEKGISEKVRNGRMTTGGGVVVATLSRNKDRIPGGRETLKDGPAEGYAGRPVLSPIVVSRVVSMDLDSPDLSERVEETCFQVREDFLRKSRERLGASPIRRPRTLVTVVRYPVHVCPKGQDMSAPAISRVLANHPEFFRGFEARCVFFQVVRRGRVSPGNFDVLSRHGDINVTLPNPRDLRQAVDIHHLIRSARFVMDRAEAGEIIERDYETRGGATTRSLGGPTVKRIPSLRDSSWPKK